MRTLLQRHLVKLVKLPGAELCELGYEYPEITAAEREEENRNEH